MVPLGVWSYSASARLSQTALKAGSEACQDSTILSFAGATQFFDVDGVGLDANSAEILVLRAIERSACGFRGLRLGNYVELTLRVFAAKLADDFIAPRVLAETSPHPRRGPIDIE